MAGQARAIDNNTMDARDRFPCALLAHFLINSSPVQPVSAGCAPARPR